jgi:hypothetical protein
MLEEREIGVDGEIGLSQMNKNGDLEGEIWIEME